MALALLLFAGALPLRWAYTHGDLWYDEADYAFAAVRGFAANSHDRPDTPSDPDKLVRLRHYHPPFVAYMAELALRLGPDARALRLPAVVAGSLTVSLVFLCALTLAAGFVRVSPGHHPAVRAVACACGVMAAVTPASLRAGSHLLPWPFLTLWIVLLLWTLLQYAATRRPAWLVGGCVSLGCLFVTSEYLFPALLACAVAAPVLFWPLVRDARQRRGVLLALLIGLVLFVAVAVALWPAGLSGGAVRMLRHYVAMASDPWPVNLRGRLYERAPKWAYLYWYWRDFRPFLYLYALGGVAAVGLAVRRRLTAGTWVLLAFCGILLLSAHKSHIIGPEYLVHVLPVLTLLCGVAFSLVARWRPWAGTALALAGALYATAARDPSSLPGMDAQSQRSRWPGAARSVASVWRPDDRMLAPQYGVVGRWYLLHVAGVQAPEWRVQAVPPSGANARVLQDLSWGVYTYVALGSTVTDAVSVDPHVWRTVSRWPVFWRSHEPPGKPCRLTIYRVPYGTTRRHPLLVAP